MSTLLIFCRECGKQVPSSQTRNGLCLDCQVRRSVAELRDEHARLWRKRERYRSPNANVEQIGRQIARVEDRMGQRIKELVSNEREAADHLQLDAVDRGGVTPSLLPADLMSRLLAFIRATFNVAPDAEVTLEANPASTDAAKVAAWLEGGVNRLSLGVQGFDPRALAVLERKTDAAQAIKAFSLARTMGMSNISIDLIYAVPFQSLETWIETLRRAIAIQPDHVSTYCLSFEEGTLLYRRRAEGRVPEVETDLQWDQLDAACDELENAGFRRYAVPK